MANFAIENSLMCYKTVNYDVILIFVMEHISENYLPGRNGFG